MPTYSYECKKCAHVDDVYHAMSADPKVTCSKCGGVMRRLMGKGAGIIFKGSGFYETDYKRNGSSKTGDGAPKKNGDSKTEPKAEPKAESKPAAKSEASTTKSD